LLAVLLVLAAAFPASLEAQDAPASVNTHIQGLAAFDYSTRMNAARMVRRAQPTDAVPALIAAAREHSDQFVRYRALVLLTSFNDRGTADVMRGLLGDPNDRVREVVYRWFEQYPQPGLTEALVAALNTEQSEFVRPALVRAVAALPPDDRIRRTLLGEIGRGFDFFRSAVIEALGRHRATYAIDLLAPVSQSDGVLQDDAVIALGRIGDVRALTLLAAVEPSADVAPAMQAAQCMLGDGCPERIAWLAESARNPATRPGAARAAITALAVVAESNEAARALLLQLAEGVPERLRRDVTLAFAAVALRDPAVTIKWIAEAPEATRDRAMDLLSEGFERLEEDFSEEQFFAVARAAYWQATDGSPTRTSIAGMIEKLEF
jgi:HEAT repeat protein